MTEGDKRKSVKLCFIDLETTGTNSKSNGVVQFAGEICLFDGEEATTLETFNLMARPFDSDEIDQRALEVTGLSLREIEGFEDPVLVYKRIIDMFSRHVDKFDKKDKLFFVAYNARFDADFMRSFFEKNNDKYFGSWFWFPPVDVMNDAVKRLMFERERLENFKLGTVAKYLGVEIKDEDLLHDAEIDIELTKRVFFKLMEAK